MATSYPTSLDTLSNPSGQSQLVDHAEQHANANDAIEALEAKLGTTSTAATLPAGIVVGKASGTSIKVDTASPTFGWADLLGAINIRGTGAADPVWAVYQGNIHQFQFTVNDECWSEFHIPHDYAPGTDIYIHAHWSHTSATVTSGSATWGWDVTVAKGHNQAAFPATVNTTIAQTASTTQYQHMIAEIQLSAASPSASQINQNTLEPDTLILVRTYLSANTINGTPEPFLHFVDIHYQTTGIQGTKQKAPSFYT